MKKKFKHIGPFFRFPVFLSLLPNQFPLHFLVFRSWSFILFIHLLTLCEATFSIQTQISFIETKISNMKKFVRANSWFAENLSVKGVLLTVCISCVLLVGLKKIEPCFLCFSCWKNPRKRVLASRKLRERRARLDSEESHKQKRNGVRRKRPHRGLEKI